MARPHSIDLYERVVAAVEQGGMSRRRATCICNFIVRVRRFRATGSVAKDGWTQRSRAHIAAGRCSGLKTLLCVGWWLSWGTWIESGLSIGLAVVDAEKPRFKKSGGW
jgi:hypothetical protein